MCWKVLFSEYLIKRPWLTARRDKVELPDGRVIPEYYVLEYPDWVNVIAITKEGQFVMERQYRYAIDRICYEIPCGVAEKGETPLEAIQRELKEETGYGGGEWQLLMTLSPNPTSMTNMTFCFVAMGVEKISDQHLDETEDLTVHLMSQEDVWKLLENNEIIQSLMVAPLTRWFMMKDKHPELTMADV